MPSQRARASSVEATPPRLVAFSISRSERSTRAACVAVGHVEGQQRSERLHVPCRHGIVETGIADRADARVGGEPPGELERARRLTLDADGEGLHPAQQQPRRIGRGDDPRWRRGSREASVILGARAADDPDERVVVAGQDLRGAVQDEVGTVLERTQQHAG